MSANTNATMELVRADRLPIETSVGALRLLRSFQCRNRRIRLKLEELTADKKQVVCFRMRVFRVPLAIPFHGAWQGHGATGWLGNVLSHCARWLEHRSHSLYTAKTQVIRTCG